MKHGIAIGPVEHVGLKPPTEPPPYSSQGHNLVKTIEKRTPNEHLANALCHDITGDNMRNNDNKTCAPEPTNRHALYPARAAAMLFVNFPTLPMARAARKFVSMARAAKFFCFHGSRSEENFFVLKPPSRIPDKSLSAQARPTPTLYIRLWAQPVSPRAAQGIIQRRQAPSRIPNKSLSAQSRINNSGPPH